MTDRHGRVTANILVGPALRGTFAGDQAVMIASQLRLTGALASGGRRPTPGDMHCAYLLGEQVQGGAVGTQARLATAAAGVNSDNEHVVQGVLDARNELEVGRL